MHKTNKNIELHILIHREYINSKSDLNVEYAGTLIIPSKNMIREIEEINIRISREKLIHYNPLFYLRCL